MPSRWLAGTPRALAGLRICGWFLVASSVPPLCDRTLAQASPNTNKLEVIYIKGDDVNILPRGNPTALRAARRGDFFSVQEQMQTGLFALAELGKSLTTLRLATNTTVMLTATNHEHLL